MCPKTWKRQWLEHQQKRLSKMRQRYKQSVNRMRIARITELAELATPAKQMTPMTQIVHLLSHYLLRKTNYSNIISH